MSTTLTYNIVSDEGKPSSVMVFVPGSTPLTATSSHENFQTIIDALKSGSTDLEVIHDLFDVSAAISKGFARVGERVAIKGSNVYLDLMPLEHDVLSEIIVRFHKEGNANFKPLVAFLEKVMLNPMEHSRKNLYRWMTKHRFMIAPDGDIIAYKGVNKHGDHFVSATAGYAVVNGEEIDNTVIPNIVGATVEMPRDMVEHNPSVACHVGLHVGNWGYASTFAARTIRVKVNPRDVVSVPTDASDSKMRVCRYVVMGEAAGEDKSMFFAVLPQRTRVVTRQKIEEIIEEAKPTNGADLRAARKAAREAKDEKPVVSEAKAKRAAKNAKKAEPKLPKFYEQYTKAQFDSLDMAELRWLVKEWEVKITAPVTKLKIVAALLKEAKLRLKTW